MENGHGGDIYAYENGECITDFSTNINPLGTPLEVIAAVASGAQSLARYPDWSCRKLREALAKHIGCLAQDVICGNGAAELIFSIVSAKKPKTALLVAPCFAEYEAALVATGADIRYHMLLPEQDFSLTADFEKALTADLDMVFLCVPNNPTGAVLEKERLTAIADICEKNNILCVLDECFNDFLNNPKAHSMMDRIAGRNHLIILKSFTKMYALAGLRLGYAVSCNHALLEEIYRQRQPWAVSSLAQRAGLAALSQTAFVAQSRAVILAERVFLEQGLLALGFRVFAGDGNFLLFYGAQGWKERLLERGFLIRDCGNYRGLGNGYYRIGVRTHDENVRLLNAMRLILEEER